MTFLKSLWTFVKTHPIGSIVVFVLIVPLVFGGVALAIYRAARSGIEKVAPSVAGALPNK
jgi:hypothetical protein